MLKLFFLILHLSVSSAAIYKGEFGKFKGYYDIGSSVLTEDDRYVFTTFDNDRTLLNLRFTKQPDNINTGDVGWVEGVLRPGYILNVTRYAVTSSQSPISISALRNITSITYALQICTLPVINITQQRNIWIKYQEYINNCTYGDYKFPLSDNIIVGPIPIPCTPEYDWRDDCKDFTWANFAQKYASNVLKININAYRYHLFVMSPGVRCPYSGLGMIGCGTTCFTFYNGPPTDVGILGLYMHEMGHNYGLHHSSDATWEYGDRSCAMGCCPTNVCFNNVQSWNLGFVKPFAVINITDIPVFPTTYTVPAHLTLRENFLKIDYGWRSYFVSYRSNIGYDNNLTNVYKNKVTVHNYYKNPSPGGLTFLEASLAEGESFHIKQGNYSIFIKYLSKTTYSASVFVCNGCINAPSPPVPFPPRPSPPPRPYRPPSPPPSKYPPYPPYHPSPPPSPPKPPRPPSPRPPPPRPPSPSPKPPSPPKPPRPPRPPRPTSPSPPSPGLKRPPPLRRSPRPPPSSSPRPILVKPNK